MATTPQLKNTLAFTLAPGASVVLPHGLSDGQKALAPDIIFLPSETLEITASDDVAITLKNNGLVPASGSILVEAWHSIEREFGAKTNVDLPVKPYIVHSDAGDVPPIKNPTSLPEQWIATNLGDGSDSGTMVTQVSANFDDIMTIRAGSIVGIRTRTTDILLSGEVTATVTLDDVPTTLVSKILTGQDNDGERMDPGVIPYVAGQRIGIQYANTSLNPTVALEAWIEVYEEITPTP